ncbi:MAG: UDP-N-acetylmuramate dehydrogenase [Pirellulaceae bacterium]
MFSDSLKNVISEDVSLAPFCWLRVGGTARFFAEVDNLELLQQICREAQEAGLKIRVLGSGSNLLVRSGPLDALVVRLTGDFFKIETKEDRIKAGGGVELGELIAVAAEQALGGIETLAGIPGSVGAAVMLNSGVTNNDIGSRVHLVTLVNEAGETSELTRDDLRFGFRRSNLEGSIVTSVELKLEPTPVAEVTRRLQTAWIVKKKSQPPQGERVAQAFIEPSGDNIAHLLEAAGMRTAEEGSAMMLPKFPGYLTVHPNGEPADVLALTARIAKAVEVQTGIQLQPQLKIW